MFFWRNTMARNLPLPQGPYTPGCADAMSECSNDSVFLRLYYPTAFTKDQNDSGKWFQWSPHDEYISGIASLVHSWAKVLKLVVWFYGGEPLVPAMWEAKPLVSEKKFPVIIFSHGYGATRFLSSTIAYELASRGFFVASIEHRDNSPSSTYYYESPEAVDKDIRTWIPHERLTFGSEHYKVRNEQLNRRTVDVTKTIDYLEQLNKGEAKNILKTSFEINNAFKGRLDLSTLTMMGHSFGGATTLLAATKDNRITCGVVLDGWMFPIKEEKLDIQKPLLFINTLTFHIESNLKVMQEFIKGSNELYTIKGTTHESQTDTPHILGYWLDWFMQKIDPVLGTNINNHMTLRFLHKHTNFPENIDESEKYLEENSENFVQGALLYAKTIKRKL